MSVFVKNMRGEALMPCSPRKARLLLREEKAFIPHFTFRKKWRTSAENLLNKRPIRAFFFVKLDIHSKI
jgi:hypothetical protein